METLLLAEVPPVERGAPGTVGWLRASVARFSSGDAHLRRRQLALDVLAGTAPIILRANAAAQTALRANAAALTALRANAAAQARALLPGDLSVIARTVPLVVLGLPPNLVGAVGAVAKAYHTGDPAADEAVATLVAAFSGTPDEATAARIAVFVQAYDATAALIENAAMSGLRAPVDEIVEAVLRDNPPVRATRRLVDGEVRLVDLAGNPFGAGPHACPGREHAIAIAKGVLDAYVP
jgi:hypothetical protein